MKNVTAELLNEIFPLLKELDGHYNYPSLELFQDGSGCVNVVRGGLHGGQLFAFSSLNEVPAKLRAELAKVDKAKAA